MKVDIAFRGITSKCKYWMQLKYMSDMQVMYIFVDTLSDLYHLRNVFADSLI